jgi:MoxR-like ATPase
MGSERTVNGVAAPTDAQAERFAARAGEMRAAIGTVIKGKPGAIDNALICLFAEGHLLVEDVPGVGKTQLARSLAAIAAASWSRVQFTPDLLPSDVTGVTVYHQATSTFEFHPGPVFANVVLADEINRASPRTQAALLEVMEERRVTVDGAARRVPRPFMVIATQNPVDMDGTYPLPEAQLDRFLMRISMGYPDHQSEMEILRAVHGVDLEDQLPPVISASDAAAMVSIVQRVHASDDVTDYLVRIVHATRQLPGVRLPVSPRGTVALLRAARARALLQARPYITPEDIRALAVPVLAHRMLLNSDAVISGTTTASLIEHVLSSTSVPHRV